MIVQAISADFHIFEGVADWANPIAIRIEFSNRFAIRIRGASDGESIIVDQQPLEGLINMEDWGIVDTHDLTAYLDAEIIETEVDEIKYAIDEFGTSVGMIFISKVVPIFCIWNFGDELCYGRYSTMIEQDWGTCIRISERKFPLP